MDPTRWLDPERWPPLVQVRAEPGALTVRVRGTWRPRLALAMGVALVGSVALLGAAIVALVRMHEPMLTVALTAVLLLEVVMLLLPVGWQLVLSRLRAQHVGVMRLQAHHLVWSDPDEIERGRLSVHVISSVSAGSDAVGPFLVVREGEAIHALRFDDDHQADWAARLLLHWIESCRREEDEDAQEARARLATLARNPTTIG
ncbi:MAG: hypothetical protein H6736_23795 [Alphaproteobacteria bacterium]|nr:hypothetical protein [Alphaproteobacteria bacterium]MCB9694845.1 hypothetical protein [Alphaproteobacteria bacterium]